MCFIVLFPSQPPSSFDRHRNRFSKSATKIIKQVFHQMTLNCFPTFYLSRCIQVYSVPWGSTHTHGILAPRVKKLLNYFIAFYSFTHRSFEHQKWFSDALRRSGWLSSCHRMTGKKNSDGVGGGTTTVSARVTREKWLGELVILSN